jgi:hypothetical protein
VTICLLKYLPVVAALLVMVLVDLLAATHGFPRAHHAASVHVPCAVATISLLPPKAGRRCSNCGQLAAQLFGSRPVACREFCAACRECSAGCREVSNFTITSRSSRDKLEKTSCEITVKSSYFTGGCRKLLASCPKCPGGCQLHGNLTGLLPRILAMGCQDFRPVCRAVKKPTFWHGMVATPQQVPDGVLLPLLVLGGRLPEPGIVAAVWPFCSSFKQSAEQLSSS